MVGLKKCTEFDDDCSDVKNKWDCWLCAPGNGYCPYLQSNIDIIRENEKGKGDFKPGQPCGHPGCASHITHPCELCGRKACGLG